MLSCITADFPVIGSIALHEDRWLERMRLRSARSPYAQRLRLYGLEVYS